MKKILFVLPSLKIGGLEKVQITIANALAERNYDITIMALNPECDLLDQLDGRVNYIYKPYKQHPIASHIPYIRHKFYDDGMWETRASAKKLYKYYIGKEKYDVEIGFFRGLPIKIISGSTIKDSIKLAWVHSDFRKASGYKNNFKRMADVKAAYSKFDKVVCVSNQAQEGFKQIIGDTENLTTIYNLLPINQIVKLAEEKPEVEVPRSKYNLVLVGRLLDSAKGQVRLIKVVSKLKVEGYELSLTLVGGGSDEKLIKETITNCSATEFIFMTGNQTNPYPYIKNSDLLVCASYFEGYNLTVAEALILGVPVLSTNCPGPNEILDGGKYGKIIDNSEEGLYQGIKELLDNPDKLQDYKKKATERLDFFNEEKIINQIQKLFEKDIV